MDKGVSTTAVASSQCGEEGSHSVEQEVGDLVVALDRDMHR
jgi:hypothetical protein